jgi:hypothetical protein
MVKVLARPLDRLHVVSFLQQIKAGSGSNSSLVTARLSLRGATNPASRQEGRKKVPVVCPCSACLRSEVRKLGAYLQFATFILALLSKKQEVLLFSAITYSFHMSILLLIMCVYIVNTIPSTSTNLHTSCELLFIVAAKTVIIKLACWLVAIHTPCQLNFCRVVILTLVEVMELRLLLPGLWFLHFALNSAHCMPGVINAV